MKLDVKLKKIFKFLNDNRKYNYQLQKKFYTSDLSPYKNKTDKVYSLLYRVANTQSKPKIDMLSKSLQGFVNNRKCFFSFKNFIDYIHPGGELTYQSLFIGMSKQPGWGPKTAALFVKTIFHIHNGDYSKKLKIWTDAPKTISENDCLKLPVDAVILAIFRRISKNKTWNFKNINSMLKVLYTNVEDIEVWDDLWFWGFITQRTINKKRYFKWNENKYWAIKEVSKNTAMIKEIEKKAKEFLVILKS